MNLSPAIRPLFATDHLFSDVRFFIFPAFDFFHVCADVNYDTFGEVGHPLVQKAYALRDEAKITTASCMLLRYLEHPGIPGPFPMQVGFMVPAGTPSYKEAKVIHFDPFPCAEITVHGVLQYNLQAYELLLQAIQKAGLHQTYESREWNLFRRWTTYVAEDDLPENVTTIQFGIRT